MDNYRKILGGLLGAAVGDALGAATETRSTKQIISKFKKPVTDFITPPDDVFARNFPKGSVTDDFSLAYYTAMAIIKYRGINNKTAIDALLSWSKTPYYSLAGPTTIKSVNKMLNINTETNESFIKYDSSKGSDGGAMKIAPVGLASKGNIQKAISDAIIICLPTHFNSTALAGACAVSAAVSAALKENATVKDMVQAGLKGAYVGNEFACKNDHELANPSVYKRILLACEIGKKYQGNMPKAMQELADIIGSGLNASETVPSAFGLLVAANGDPWKSIIAAVNIGNDTDTIATIVGAMAGTLNSYYDKEKLRIINNVNNFDLERIAGELNNV